MVHATSGLPAMGRRFLRGMPLSHPRTGMTREYALCLQSFNHEFSDTLCRFLLRLNGAGSVPDPTGSCRSGPRIPKPCRRCWVVNPRRDTADCSLQNTGREDGHHRVRHRSAGYRSGQCGYLPSPTVCGQHRQLILPRSGAGGRFHQTSFQEGVRSVREGCARQFRTVHLSQEDRFQVVLLLCLSTGSLCAAR